MAFTSTRGPGAALAAVLLCVPCLAERNAIRLTGSSQPGCWNVEEIVNEATKGAGSDREKALALHRFGMAHFIHFDGPIEERGEYVADPMKLIAVYGYALCGNNSAAMNALYNAAGLSARRRSVPGHSIPEVWFEGKWNYIDTDMFGYVFLPDGKIASVDELSRDADLFMRQTSPPSPFYPFDKKEDMASTFRGRNASKDFHPYTNAHMMDLSLRSGRVARGCISGRTDRAATSSRRRSATTSAPSSRTITWRGRCAKIRWRGATARRRPTETGGSNMRRTCARRPSRARTPGAKT